MDPKQKAILALRELIEHYHLKNAYSDLILIALLIVEHHDPNEYLNYKDKLLRVSDIMEEMLD